MKLFSKEKGIVFSTLNAIFIIWIVSAFIITISNITKLVIKDYTYTYEEYRVTDCNFEYETEEQCKNNYTIYKVNSKNYNTDYKRNIIISISNVIVVSGILLILNKEKKQK